MTTLTGNQPPQSPLPTEFRRDEGIDFGTILSKLGPLIGLGFVVALFSALRYRTFFTVDNFELILRLTAVVGIASLGMTLIIISGGIDLSVGSAIALVCVCIALFMPHKVTDIETGAQVMVGGMPPILAVLAALAVGTMCGLLNGVLITRLKLPPFIITLGMMSALRGLAEQIANSTMIYPKISFLNRIMKPINPDRIWMLSPAVWLMLFLALIVAGMLRYTRFGRHTFAIGSNEQTARLCGVPVERAKILIYMLGALLAAIAAVLQFSYLTMGDPTTATGMELDIIAAVVIGGASLNGGQGTILGSLVGALIMSVVSNGCSMVGVGNPVQLMVTGGIIILAVALDRLRHRTAA
jgi:ribose transport system permease protein